MYGVTHSNCRANDRLQSVLRLSAQMPELLKQFLFCILGIVFACVVIIALVRVHQ
jgi:hypothetical protein